jgi:hypothetical protein
MDFERFDAWLDRYKRAWESRDPDAAQAIFTADATYQVTPFREPEIHRDGIRAYWVRATRDQRNVQFGSDMLAANGDTGVCRWRVQFDVVTDGTRVEIDGIFVFTLNDDGLCSRFQEWWHERISDPA